MTNLLTKINISDENDYFEAISSSINLGQKKIFFYLNSHILYETKHDPLLEEYFLKCDYLIADGYSIVWAIKALFQKRIQKVVFTYSYLNFIRYYFIKNKVPIFFLGASKTNLEKAFQHEKETFPNLLVAGAQHGYFDKKLESDEIIKSINDSKAEILIVGMGCPLAENWIMKNKDELQPKIICSVGGFFDFLAKEKKIAPKWMHNSGLEWIFRLVQEPKRLFKRYLFSNIWFVYFVIKSKMKSAFRKN